MNLQGHALTCFQLLCGSHSLQQKDTDQCPALVSIFKEHLCVVADEVRDCHCVMMFG